jgi:hypothetical protein
MRRGDSRRGPNAKNRFRSGSVQSAGRNIGATQPNPRSHTVPSSHLSRRFAAAAALVVVVLGAASSAHARSDVTFSIGIQVPGAYVQPAPVYLQPPHVYYQPQPVYVRPRPVFVQPPAYGVYYRSRPDWRRTQWGSRGSRRAAALTTGPNACAGAPRPTAHNRLRAGLSSVPAGRPDPQFTDRVRPSQCGLRSSVFWIFPAPVIGKDSRNSTLRGHL